MRDDRDRREPEEAQKAKLTEGVKVRITTAAPVDGRSHKGQIGTLKTVTQASSTNYGVLLRTGECLFFEWYELEVVEAQRERKG